MYLGFLINADGVRSDQAKIEVVRGWPIPCSLTDVRAFLGFCNYHRQFIRNYAAIAAPLVELTTFKWTDSQQQAFKQLRNDLIHGPLLPHPDLDPSCALIMDTETSLSGLGGVLSQVVNGHERVLAYASPTLNSSQCSYCATYRKLLAVVKMIKHFRHYLWGRHFTLRTDHASLVWLKNYRDADGMLARWLAKLEEYNFDTIHSAGKSHGNAYGISRCHLCKNPRCVDKMAPLLFSDSEPIPAKHTSHRQDSTSNMDLSDVGSPVPPIPTTNIKNIAEIQSNDPVVSLELDYGWQHTYQQ